MQRDNIFIKKKLLFITNDFTLLVTIIYSVLQAKRWVDGMVTRCGLSFVAQLLRCLCQAVDCDRIC